MNILNKPFNTPYNTAPFSKIKNEHFLPAFKSAIKKAKKEIDAITSNQVTINIYSSNKTYEYPQ